MRLKDSFKIWKSRDQYIIVNTTQQNINLAEIVTLNETSAFLWNKIYNIEFTKDDLVEILLSEYEISREIAEADIDNFIIQMRRYGFITE